MKVYLVWERESYCEYDVILTTLDENTARQVSGENEASGWHDKKNDTTERWYEERILDVQTECRW